MVLLLCVGLSFLLPSPWNALVIAGGVVAEVGEIVWGRRLARRLRPQTGVEADVGATAEVVEPCRPDGRVRYRGELWRAHSTSGADAGETVRIARVRHLVLDVEPLAVPVRRSPEQDEVELPEPRFR